MISIYLSTQSFLIVYVPIGLTVLRMNPGSKSNQSSSFRKKAAESAVRRNFEMYLPNTSYPMFDAYMRSQPCTEARKRSDLSTDGGRQPGEGLYILVLVYALLV